MCTLLEQARKYSLVKLCIRQAQRVKLVSKQHEHNISILQDQQLKDKILKKENSSRRKIEKKLQCVAEKEVELSNEFTNITMKKVLLYTTV